MKKSKVALVSSTRMKVSIFCSILAVIVIILGKNPNSGGRPARDINKKATDRLVLKFFSE